MRLIVEGPDGAGKTTLIKRILEDVPDAEQAPRMAKSKTGPVDDLLKVVEADARLDHKDKKLVYDRHALVSDYIYGPIIRGWVTPGLDQPEICEDLVWDFWTRRSQLVVICLPPLEEVQKNVKYDPDQMDGVSDRIAPIWWAYHQLLVWSQMSDQVGFVFHYDYTSPLKGAMYDGIINFVRFPEAWSK